MSFRNRIRNGLAGLVLLGSSLALSGCNLGIEGFGKPRTYDQPAPIRTYVPQPQPTNLQSLEDKESERNRLVWEGYLSNRKIFRVDITSSKFLELINSHNIGGVAGGTPIAFYGIGESMKDENRNGIIEPVEIRGLAENSGWDLFSQNKDIAFIFGGLNFNAPFGVDIYQDVNLISRFRTSDLGLSSAKGIAVSFGNYGANENNIDGDFAHFKRNSRLKRGRYHIDFLVEDPFYGRMATASVSILVK